MASRTKSFFDQDPHRSKKPVHWNRPSKAILSEATPNVAPKPPAIPATTEAKSKLKAFQFAPNDVGHGRSTAGLDNKENLIGAQHHAEGKDYSNGAETEAKQDDCLPSKSPQQKTTKTPQLLHANTFPCTPSARLPLEYLIGNSDEANNFVAPVAQSPEEQICWNPNSSVITPNRKRKRARSSSPSCPTTSSQSQKASKLFAVDDENTTKETPEADPVADLWQRYANGKQYGDNLNLPDFSHLISHGSPRPLETPIKSGALRRWASTGNEWPSSKSKRRRTNVPTNIELWQDQTTEEQNGQSKVAAMVQKIRDSLAAQNLEQLQTKVPVTRVEGPSSSSPLPDTSLDPAAIIGPTSPLFSKQPPPDPQIGREGPAQRVQFNEHTFISAPLYLQSKARLPAYKKPSITRRQEQPKEPSQTTAPAVGDDLDEFGDSFELTSADLDEIMTEVKFHQRSLHDIPAHPNPPVQQNLVFEDTIAQNHAEIVAIDDEDEYGGNDIDDDCFAQAEFSATQALRSSHKKESPRKKQRITNDRAESKTQQAQSSAQASQTASQFQRYKVKQVIDGEYADSKGRSCTEKLLLAEPDNTSRTTAISLQGSWMSTSISQDDVIHIAYLRHSDLLIGNSQNPVGQVILSDDEHSPFIIVHPDHLLSATTVADSFDCIRKAVLQDRIKATGETSKPMVYGKILHEIFQQALSSNKWDVKFLDELVERTIQNHVEGLWELGMRDTNLAVEEIRTKMSELSGWAGVFVAAEPSSTSFVDDKNGEKALMSISKLIAIEEHIWSPRYGLKGNVDATVQTTLAQDPKTPMQKLIAPFEVKTGRTTYSPAHRAQTALYTLLLSDRYDVNVSAGMLYYLESSSMSRIAPPLNEIRQMIQQRNRLATYIYSARNPPQIEHVEERNFRSQEMKQSGLPGLLKSPYKCGRCYAQQSCFTFHALVENGTAQTAGMVDDNKKNHSSLWNQAVGHLSLVGKNKSQAETLKKWFSKWDRLLTFEESEQSKLRKELWTMSSKRRQEVGRCFGGLVLAQDLSSTATSITSTIVDGIEGGGGKINRFAYVFVRAEMNARGSFTEGSQLTVGEPVVVSSEQGQWALANGYVIAVSKHEITVAVDRRLGNARRRLGEFDTKNNQALQGIMTAGDVTMNLPSSNEEKILYRLDKDEFSNGLALIRNNLVSLMSSHPIHTKLRNQLVFGQPPAFTTASAPHRLCSTQVGEMNDDQHAAVNTVLNAKDYALILGMPGTGKTTTIAHIICALLEQNQSILLTSFTHTAVDNILLKLRNVVPDGSILRLGQPAKINKQVQNFCQLAATPRKNIDEVERAYMESEIVATTCMGTNHALFNRRAFDVCIVDEASQITLPTILGPLLRARKYVLVGDHYQLPPLVQNKAALEGGFDVSLFRQLSEQHPEAVATLGCQYRMCEDIMSLSNTLVYDGKLRCGNNTVAQRTLQLREPAALRSYHSSITACRAGDACWLWRATKPAEKLVFANIDPMGKSALETLSSGKNITNQLEATLSAQLVMSLLALGVAGSEIGVVTLYRSQLTLMRQLFKRAGIPGEVEIDSADRFQGRDKECIILSMVRSNESGIVGDLLKDWRRVNVALTRARSKLIILGSRRTLKNNDLLSKLLSLVSDRCWSFDLPESADENHCFDFSSQTTEGLTLTPSQKPNRMKLASPQKSPAGRSPLREIRNPPSSQYSSPTAVDQGEEMEKTVFPKVIDGLAGGNRKMKKIREQMVVEILEDD